MHVRVYSHSSYGDIQTFRDQAESREELDCRTGVLQVLNPKDVVLAALIARCAPGLSRYKFLNRVFFDFSKPEERLLNKLRECRYEKAINSDQAFEVLWAHLERLGTWIEDSNLSPSG